MLPPCESQRLASCAPLPHEQRKGRFNSSPSTPTNRYSLSSRNTQFLNWEKLHTAHRIPLAATLFRRRWSSVTRTSASPEAVHAISASYQCFPLGDTIVLTGSPASDPSAPQGNSPHGASPHGPAAAGTLVRLIWKASRRFPSSGIAASSSS